mmetsp:Transcript_1109/g.2706  ORF Transcript_1109/g.2706 Transcript_1109/m.2706 type:complete len:878 (+) Transcript_1109:41-2674(+)
MKSYTHDAPFSLHTQDALPSQTLPHRTNFEAARRKSRDSTHSLYRFDGNMMIVYDSDARLRDEPISLKSDGFLFSKEPTPLQLQELEGASAYDRSQFLCSPNYPPHKYHNPQYTLQVPPDVLRFDSKFESGNLKKALRVSDSEYNLYISPDVETKGHTQWYYFSVKSFKSNHTVRFNIMNLHKYESLYNEGLKPCVYSVTKYKKTGKKWLHGGTSISYYQNSTLRKKKDDKEDFYYTLTFTYNFEYASDTVYFAHWYPYTYNEMLIDVENYKGYTDIVRVDELCTSLAGNSIPVLTITQNVESYCSWDTEQRLMTKTKAGRQLERNREARRTANSRLVDYYHDRKSGGRPDHKKKKGIVLTARVHPGETGGSFMMKGAIEYLISNARGAKMLRKNFVFRIIPMLNPDGVIYGNSRCSLLGVDLNRRWKTPLRLVHPEIYYTKKLITVFSEVHEIAMYCDMHGHSAKKDVFMYGCSCEDSRIDSRRSNVLIKSLPISMALKNDMFNYNNCHFRLEPSKAATARIVLFEELGILGSYTIEASFYGSPGNEQLEELEGHMMAEHLEKIGKDLCMSLMMYANRNLFAKQLVKARNFLKGRDLELDQETPEDDGVIDSVGELAQPQAPQIVLDFATLIAQEVSDMTDQSSKKSADDDSEEEHWEEKEDVETRLRRLLLEPSSSLENQVTYTEHIKIKPAEDDSPQNVDPMAELLEVMSDGAQEDFKCSSNSSESEGSGDEEASEDERRSEVVHQTFRYKRRRLPTGIAPQSPGRPTSKTLKKFSRIRVKSLNRSSAQSIRPQTAEVEMPMTPKSPKITIRSRLVQTFLPDQSFNRSFLKSRESPRRELLRPKLAFCPSRTDKPLAPSLMREKGRRLSTHTRI